MTTLILALWLALAPPLPVDHVSQWGPGAGDYVADCSCAVGTMFLETFTGQRVTVDQCCAELGGCPVHLMAVSAWLEGRGVPMAWGWSVGPDYERGLIRDLHPFATVVFVGGVYHAVIVSGFDDAAGVVWVNDPMGAAVGQWPRWNYEAIQWRDPDGRAFVLYPLVPLTAGSWRQIDPRILARLQ